jgi:hypothetical protein
VEAEGRERLEKLRRATDKLRNRFGFEKVQFGGSLRADDSRATTKNDAARFLVQMPILLLMSTPAQPAAVRVKKEHASIGADSPSAPPYSSSPFA